MARYAGGIAFGSGGSCANGRYNNQWTSSATGDARAGQLVCEPVSTGGLQIAWSFDTAGVVVLADGTDGPSLYQRWTGNAYLVSST